MGERILNPAPVLWIAAAITGGAGLTVAAPLILALALGESILPFLIPLGIALGLIGIVTRADRSRLAPTRREALLAAVATWVGLALFGMLPYLLGSAPGGAGAPVDAFFESASGFTATGATVITDLDAQSRALLLWRAQTQWIGGIGLIVLAVIFMQRLAVGGRQLIATEPSGPEIERVSPRLRGSAVRVVAVYVAITLLLIAGLTALGRLGLAPGMGVYEAVTHAFTTVSAGGFSPEPRSIEPFGPWAQWLILLGIVLAGTNLALWFRALAKGEWGAFRDEELRWYFLILLGAGGLVTLEIIDEGLYGLEAGVRTGLFQAASIMTGTGYATVDFALWPELALGTLFLLMFVGGCAGSPTGALKVSRLLLVGKTIGREMVGSIHPERVRPIRVGGRVVGDRIVRGALAYVLLYLVVVIITSVALLIDPGAPTDLSYENALAAIAATMGNVGPGFGFFGPMGSYEPFSDQAKVLMGSLMIVGRLEIFPILLLMTRVFWRS